MKPLPLFLSFLAGLILGAAGLFLILPPPPASLDLEAHVIPDQATDPEPPTEHAAITATIDDDTCEETLAMVRQAHSEAIRRFSENEQLVDYLSDMVERTALDRPLEFPEFLNEQSQPEGVLAAVDKLMEECPDLFSPESTVVDCSEYPCFIEVPFAHTVQNYDFAADCPSIHDHLGPGSTTFQIPAGDERRLIYAPAGEGIGLQGFLSANEARHRVRLRLRGEERRREIAHELFEEDCLVGADPMACRRLAAAYRALPDDHLLFLQAGCDADDADACRLHAYHSCITHGRCTPAAEASARRALALSPGNAAALDTLATILCQQQRASEANALYQQACAAGHNSCSRSC